MSGHGSRRKRDSGAPMSLLGISTAHRLTAIKSARSLCWTTAPKRTVLDAPCLNGVRVPDGAGREARNRLREIVSPCVSTSRPLRDAEKLGHFG